MKYDERWWHSLHGYGDPMDPRNGGPTPVERERARLEAAQRVSIKRSLRVELAQRGIVAVVR